jgi:hypothetical protein
MHTRTPDQLALLHLSVYYGTTWYDWSGKDKVSSAFFSFPIFFLVILLPSSYSFSFSVSSIFLPSFFSLVCLVCALAPKWPSAENVSDVSRGFRFRSGYSDFYLLFACGVAKKGSANAKCSLLEKSLPHSTPARYHPSKITQSFFLLLSFLSFSLSLSLSLSLFLSLSLALFSFFFLLSL